MRARIALWVADVHKAKREWITRLRETDGQTAVEYGVLLALILAISVVVIGLLGVDVFEAFNKIEDKIGGDDGNSS